MSIRARTTKKEHKPSIASVPSAAAPRENHWSTSFLVFALVATWSAFYNGIWDCDESMNYFEPLHQILFGYGLQTWEYSPLYALRSYFYILIHTAGALVPKLLELIDLVPMTKISIFYGVRMLLGLCVAGSNTYLHDAVQKKYGMDTAQVLQLFLVVTPGMFISSTAFLPSTMAMCCYAVMLGAWMKGKLIIAYFMVALAAIVAWPFSILVGLPFAIYVLMNRGLHFSIGYGIVSLLLFMVPVALIDSAFYGKWVIAPLNIVLYNVFGHAGPELYGVEPWYYYMLNGFLNFNLVFLLALAAPMFIALLGWKTTKWVAAKEGLWFIAGAYIWLAYMSIVPHKEERFLFVIYPWLCVAAAMAVTAISHLFFDSPKTIGMLIALLLLVVVALSVSRTASLYINYEAPNAVFTHLHNLEYQSQPYSAELFSSPPQTFAPSKLVCLGKEWYRFSTHFFLPPHLRIAFIKDGFDGQLPQYYGKGPTAYSRIPPHFNDLNKEEPWRYSDMDTCDYWVNFFETPELLQAFQETFESKWQVAFEAPFLSVAHSPNTIARAFYIPYYSEAHNVYGSYVLIRKKTNEGF